MYAHSFDHLGSFFACWICLEQFLMPFVRAVRRTAQAAGPGSSVSEYHPTQARFFGLKKSCTVSEFSS